MVDVHQIYESIEIAPNFNAENHVNFFLTTRANPNPTRITVGDVGLLYSTTFNAAHPTRILIHGWNGGTDSLILSDAAVAFRNQGDFNSIGVDWGVGAQTVDYIAARNRVSEVGDLVGRMANFLFQNGNSFATMSIIGHSLGGHTAGMAGKAASLGRVGSIIGLDPAGPLFHMDSPNERLTSSDGEYVEVIHTNGWTLGFGEPIGQADFFPNWGSSQPGCGIDLIGSCAHGRAVEFFIESINSNNFWSTRCSGFDDISNKSCSTNGDRQRMGGEPSNRGRGANGIYHLSTSGASPFSQG